MIIIKVEVSVSKAGKNNFERILTEVVDSALLLNGCLNYQWFKNPVVADSYFVFAEFMDKQSFEEYKSSSVVKKIGKELVPLAISKPKFRHFEATVFEES